MTTKAKLKLKFTKCNQITAFTFLTLQTSNTTVVSSTSTEEINITTRVNHFMKCKNIIPFNTNINTDLCWRERWREAAGPGPGPSQHSHSHPRHTGPSLPGSGSDDLDKKFYSGHSWSHVSAQPTPHTLTLNHLYNH